MKKVTWAGIVFLLLLATCTPEPNSKARYYAFSMLLDEQIKILSQHNRTLDKVTDIEGVHSRTKFQPTVKEWQAEFEVFRDLENINKPAYRNAYKEEDSVKDTRSNLLIRRFTATDVPLSPVEFYYQDTFAHLKKIEASVAEDNLLYSSSRKLVLEFGEGEPNHPLLTRYSLKGFQKMFLRDTVHLSIRGEIEW